MPHQRFEALAALLPPDADRLVVGTAGEEALIERAKAGDGPLVSLQHAKPRMSSQKVGPVLPFMRLPIGLLARLAAVFMSVTGSLEESGRPARGAQRGRHFARNGRRNGTRNGTRNEERNKERGTEEGTGNGTKEGRKNTRPPLLQKGQMSSIFQGGRDRM
jgi:hypothetical protein